MAPLTFHAIAVTPVVAGLRNAHALISKAQTHAQTASIDPNDLLTARLAPDMGDFRFQIYRFTDSAKFIPSRVNPAVEAYSLPDEEQTFEELLERIQKTIAYLEGVGAEKFVGQEEQEVILKFAGGTVQAVFTGAQYVTEFAHPNFWFHVTTAYNILRSKGVDVGKFDFLNGAQSIKITSVTQEE